MATRIDFTLDQDDDPYVTLTATEGGVARNFQTSLDVVEFILKARPTTPDGEAVATLRSDGVAPKVTISGATATVDLAGQVDVPGRLWYRARLYAGGAGGRKRSFVKGWIAVPDS